MTKRLKGGRRGLTKKVTSINFFVDQAIQIQAIMEATGETKEAPLVRQLVDEALAARRRRSVQQVESEQSTPTQDISQSLETIETLLLRLLGQGETTFRIQSVSLELLQETLAEAHAGKVSLWEFFLNSLLKDKGRSVEQIARLVNAQDAQSKSFAYGLAEEIKNQLIGREADSENSNRSDDD